MLIQQFSLIDIYIFASIVLLFLFSLIFKAVSSKPSNVIEYLVAGRKLTFPMFTATLIATWYSGIFGVTQISFEHGIYNFVTQGLFWYLAATCFAIFIVEKARKTEALTLADMFGRKYGKNTGRFTGLLLLFKTLPIPYAISIGIFIKFLTGVELNLGIIIGSILVTIYCISGGIRLTLYTDIAQFFLMFLSMSLVVYFSYSDFGGAEYLKANLPASHFSIKGSHNLSTVFLWIFIAFSTTLLSPVFYQRCFAAASSKIAKKGILVSICFWFLCDILTTLAGLYARAHMPSALPSEAFLQHSLQILPAGFKGFFLAAIAIVLFSALDSYLFIASSTFFHDILGKKYRNSVKIRRASVVVAAIITTILATFFNGSIERVWVLTESVFLAAALVPMLGIYFFEIGIDDKRLAYIMGSSALLTITWEALGLAPIVDGFYIGALLNLTLMLTLGTIKKIQ